MGRLQKWLLEKPKPKFVLSPSMLLPRHRRAVQRDARLDPSNLSALHSDGWDGYPNTLCEVLAYIAHKKIEGVVFLSGDEHRGCVATVELLDMTNTLITRIHSLHTAAAYAPFPFANSLDEDIVCDETIDIVSSYGNYRCKVSARRPPPGDGATFLSVRKDGASWKLDYEFADRVVQTLSL
jgi:cholesterol oxidase